MIILREKKTPEQVQADLHYTDAILLADTLLDHQIREAGAPDRQGIINQILAKDFDTSPENFHESLVVACNAIHGEYLSPRSLASLRKLKTYKVRGINAGFALSQMKGVSGYPEIVAVHNASAYHHLGSVMIPTAVDLGGKYLECFGEHLANVLYKVMGFEVYKTLTDIKMRNGTVSNLYFMKFRW
jgi:hypothetical protein